METIALICSGGVGILAVVTIIILSTKLAAVTPGLVAMGKEQIVAMRAQAAAEIERDEAIVKQRAAEFAENEANRQLTKLHQEFADTLKENADALVRQIRFAPDIATALDIFNGVLPKVPIVRADTSPEASRASDTDLEDPRSL